MASKLTCQCGKVFACRQTLSYHRKNNCHLASLTLVGASQAIERMLQQLTFLCDRVSIIEKRMGFRPRKVSVRKKEADRRTESIHAAMHAAGDRDGEDRTRLTEEKATKMEDEMATEVKALNGTDDMTEADPKAETNDMSGEEAEAHAGSSAGATEEDNEIETETETETEARGQKQWKRRQTRQQRATVMRGRAMKWLMLTMMSKMWCLLMSPSYANLQATTRSPPLPPRVFPSQTLRAKTYLSWTLRQPAASHLAFNQGIFSSRSRELYTSTKVARTTRMCTYLILNRRTASCERVEGGIFGARNGS